MCHNRGVQTADVEPFKTCRACSRRWESRGSFLSDPKIQVVGYQAFLDNLGLGQFLFNHEECGTTLALRAGSFEDLYDGPVYFSRVERDDGCPDYCFSAENLQTCPEACECAWAREVLQKVINWPKSC